ncbi:MAG: protein-methionine-sulfoxide reductase catalytic subunit MsrP [Proteobacteria bacterium]|nr:protein-methionine-sulfoxide reductase catalytic subunit MsrP [Pseudomonadota bacterium]
MLTRIRRGWELPESAATPESIYHERRSLVKALAAGPILLAGGGLLVGCDDPDQTASSMSPVSRAHAAETDPTAELYPVPRNETYTVERAITDEESATTYNNFYEFGSHKQIADEAQALPLRPWTVTFDGMVEKEKTVDFDTLIRQMPLEERVYRHRCVEAWAMTVPWSGFAMKALVDFAAPLGSAKYVRMETFMDPGVAPGQKASWYPWPYVEGLTIEEARNDLAFIATGLYGRPMPKQNGAPLRLAVPWKYGFKSIKSIVRFSFTDERPTTFWEDIQSREYGFWANVNPAVSHPRWSQADERLLGVDTGRVPTRIYNGYGEFVSHLYEGLQDQKLFM